MHDPTEGVRRALVEAINSEVEGYSYQEERLRLVEKYGEVWDTEEVSRDFVIEGFLAPFVVATHKETRKRGCLMFQHSPRFYFLWEPEP